MGTKLSPDDPWYLATWEGAERAGELAWERLSDDERRVATEEHKRIVVGLARSRGQDISHILTAPDPATPEARARGCICPDPRPGELHMLPECPVHHYSLGFLPERR